VLEDLVRADIPRQVETVVGSHPAVHGVRLVGSRATGHHTAVSDWDLMIDTDDFRSVAAALPALVNALRPIAQQWDRLSTHQTYMLVLSGPAKVDLLFDVPHVREPPWSVSRDTLPAIDDHFWDWILWLLSKEGAGRVELLRDELQLLFLHVLEPMGVGRCPSDLPAAVHAYLDARGRQERRHGLLVARTLEREVRGIDPRLG
jgi:predicted nucleotidyltransferase